MARKLVVEVVGDASSLERAFRKSTADAKRFDDQIGKVGRGATAASGVFGGLGRSVAFASSGFLGGFGLVAAIKASVDAASDLEQQVSKTQVVFGTSGQAVVEWSKTLVNSFGLSQRAALETASSIGALLAPIGVTGDEAARQSERLTELGADLASFYNTDVQSALDAIRSGLVGESEPLRRYGVQLSEARVQQEALNESGKRSVKSLTNYDKALARIKIIFADSTKAQGDFARTGDTLANRLKIAQANIQDLEASIGQTLVPILNQVVGAFSEWISKSENQREVLTTVRDGVSALKDVLSVVKDAFDRLNGVTGSTINSLKLLVGAFVAFKLLKLAGTLTGIANSIGLIGTSAQTSTGQVTGLRSGLGKLRGIGAIAIGVSLAIGITETPQYKAFRKFLDEHTPGTGGGKSLGDRLLGNLGDQAKIAFSTDPDVSPLAAILKEETSHGPGGAVKDFFARILGQGKKSGKLTADGFKKIAEDVAKAIAGVGTRVGEISKATKDDPGLTKKEIRERTARLRAARDAVRKENQERAQIAVDRAGLTEPVQDDIRALERLNALLKRRIAGEQAVISNERSSQAERARAQQALLANESEQIGVQKQIQALQQQIVQNRIDRLEFGVDASKATKGLQDDLAALERLRAFLVKRLAADKGNLDLQRKILDVNQQIADVQKQRRDARQFRRLGLGPEGEEPVPGVKGLKKQLASVNEALSGSFLDTRKTRGLLAHIRQVLSGGLGSVSAEVRSKISEILADLKQQLKQTSVDVTKFDDRARGQFALAGAHPEAGRGITVNGGIHLHGVQDVKALENALAKRRHQRAQARGGSR